KVRRHRLMHVGFGLASPEGETILTADQPGSADRCRQGRPPPIGLHLPGSLQHALRFAIHSHRPLFVDQVRISPSSLDVLMLLVPQDWVSTPIPFNPVYPRRAAGPAPPSMCRPVLPLPPARPAVNMGTPSSEWIRAHAVSVVA